MSFVERLDAAMTRNASALCVGLDPTLEALPEGVERSPRGILAFNRAVIEVTADLACAYKPNLAFYEALGSAGWEVLAQTIRAVPRDIPVIADAKRGDIGSTAAAYAAALYDELGCDACTVSPYLGFDAVAPFIVRPGSFAFVLCRTSNPSAATLQDLPVGGVPLYVTVATMVRDWGRPNSCGLVVGATDPLGAARIATAAPDTWLLAPGLGAQGGDLAATVAALGAAARRTIWPVSRGITSVERGSGDYITQVRAAAVAWHTRLNDSLHNR